MRVLIDTSYATRGPSGTGIYVEQLVRALRARDDVEVLEAAQPRRWRRGRSGGRWNPARSAANAALDLHWVHRGLPAAARRVGADVVHHPLPAWSRRIRVPQAITVHDVAFAAVPEHFDPLWRRLARRSHSRAARRADAAICVSKATAVEAQWLLGADPARIVVAPHGPGQEMPVIERSESPGWFLYVGDAEPRKGVRALLDAHAALDAPPELVLAGAAAAAAEGQDGVRGEPAVDARRLAELLAGAVALVHPSLHEGFGLTLLEAMRAATPVVAVRNTAVEELCADAALLVSPGELGPAMARVADDRALGERLAAVGRRRAEAYSWARSAELHVQAYGLAAGTARVVQ